jgi:signal transduction histidine kinase
MDLRRTQSQMLLSESAASLGRLAAALSHEFNTPLGVLKSNLSTLSGLASRVSGAPPEQQERLRNIQAELISTLGSAVDRMQEIVGRVQRYTNLDRAEIQATNLSELLTDVIHLHEPIFDGRAKVEFHFEQMPRVMCRPQMLSAVFSNLIANAVAACDGNGRVVIRAVRHDGEAEVRIEDNGRGLSPEELRLIFDPGFKVDQGKVSTGNWGLFGSRQIVHEHGGEIRIISEPGQGTTVSVFLPLTGDLLG